MSLDDESGLQTGGEGRGDVDQAMGGSASEAIEMRVALEGATMMGEFEMPGAVAQEGAMDQADLLEASQGTVDGDLVEVVTVGAVCDLALREGFSGGEQDSQDGDVAAGTP